MEKLFGYYRALLQHIDLSFKRSLYEEIHWDSRLIAITGARGVGKTMMLLQYIKENFTDYDEVLYVSLDHLYFGHHKLFDLADEFVKNGGQYLFLDEVHKYPDWSKEIKNIYDFFPELKVVLTGSSALSIHRAHSDLSRRMLVYKMHGLSFREFIRLKYGVHFDVLTLDDICNNPDEYARQINREIKPLKLFREYLNYGYYPFFMESDAVLYHYRLGKIVDEVLETDLPAMEDIKYNSIFKLKRLIAVLSEVVPFKLNISKLSRQLEVSRETLIKYLLRLERANLLLLLNTDTYGISKMNKPQKVYLNNTNLLYTLSERQPNKGTIRETFFFNQLQVKHSVFYSAQTDFWVDERYSFEIGGKSKTSKQIKTLKDAFVVMDDIEYPHKKNIPIWLFGFLY